MTKDNHQNYLPCQFAETLVAVLYGEASPAERKEFKLHFNDCNQCREELASFGSIRDAVSEWRAVDFDSAKNLTIVLPEMPERPIRQIVETSWTERIRSYIFSSNGRFKGSLAFGGLAMCAVLLAVFGYFLVNRLSSRGVYLADASNIDRSERVINTSAPNPVVAISPTPQPNQKQTTDSKPIIDDLKMPLPTDVKQAVRQRKPIALPSPSQHQPLRNPATKVPVDPRIPELADESVDDLEDHSLRLSDLLDEVTPSM